MDTINFEDSGKLIRLGDNIETLDAIGWLSVSGTLPKSKVTAEQALNNIRKHYKTILTNFPTLRLKIINEKDKDGEEIPYWYYATNEEIQFDNLIQIVKEAPMIDEVPQAYDLGSAPIWRVHITPFEEKTKIKVIASHAIVDGRGIFDLFELFSTYAQDQELSERLKKAQGQPVLYDYGKKDWFTQEYLDKHKTIEDPYKDFKFPTTPLNPKISTPSHGMNLQWDVDYLPISKFCRKHSVSPQALIMAIQNEAIRSFNEGKYDNIPVLSYCPADIRSTPHGSELLKKSLFFVRIGNFYAWMKDEKDILQNIKNCYMAMKEALKKDITCDVALLVANMRDHETKKMVLSGNFPSTYSYIFASHLGLVGAGLEDIQFRFNYPIFEDAYWATFYGFHTKETFSFMFNVPYNAPERYYQSVKETSLKYYNYILNDIKN